MITLIVQEYPGVNLSNLKGKKIPRKKKNIGIHLLEWANHYFGFYHSLTSYFPCFCRNLLQGIENGIDMGY